MCGVLWKRLNWIWRNVYYILFHNILYRQRQCLTQNYFIHTFYLLSVSNLIRKWNLRLRFLHVVHLMIIITGVVYWEVSLIHSLINDKDFPPKSRVQIFKLDILQNSPWNVVIFLLVLLAQSWPWSLLLLFIFFLQSDCLLSTQVDLLEKRFV